MTHHANQSQSELSRLTRDELRELARGANLKGFGSMRKSELIVALAGPTVAAGQEQASQALTEPLEGEPKVQAAPQDLSSASIFAAAATRPILKNRRLATDKATEDLLEVEALDSRWMHVSWSLSARTLERAVAAMGVDWHLASPNLRLYRLTCDESGPRSKSVSQDCPLPADARQWYLTTPVPGGVWQVELGYLARTGRFYPLMHSLPEQLPENSRAHSRPLAIEHVEERQHAQEGNGYVAVRFQAELSISGVTLPGARVMVNEEAVSVEQDGTFQCFAPLPDGRIVLPIEVVSALGRQRILMGIERNTRFLEAEPDDTEH